MICAACQNGTLEQKFADTISCPKCHSAWKNYSLSVGSSKSYRRSKYKAGRS